MLLCGSDAADRTKVLIGFVEPNADSRNSMLFSTCWAIFLTRKQSLHVLEKHDYIVWKTWFSQFCKYRNIHLYRHHGLDFWQKAFFRILLGVGLLLGTGVYELMNFAFKNGLINYETHWRTLSVPFVLLVMKCGTFQTNHVLQYFKCGRTFLPMCL